MKHKIGDVVKIEGWGLDIKSDYVRAKIIKLRPHGDFDLEPLPGELDKFDQDDHLANPNDRFWKFFNFSYPGVSLDTDYMIKKVLKEVLDE